MATTESIPTHAVDWRRSVRIGVAVLAFLLIVDALIAWWMLTGTGLAVWDVRVHNALLNARTPLGDAAMTVVTKLGQTLPVEIFAVLVCTVSFLRWRRWSIWALPILTAVGSVSLTEGLKLVFARPRPPYAEAIPPYEHSFSFPSGHTLNTTAIAGILAYLVVWLARRAWAKAVAVIAAASWAALMGFSRIYLGHHWPTDVAAGWITGLAWLTVVITIHQAAIRHDPELDAGPPPVAASS